MATKSNRSSGTQHNARGVTQGNTLVDPKSGLPISVIEDNEGRKRLAVDANISADFGDINVDLDYNEDSVSIGDPNTQTNLKINPNGSVDANVEIDALDGDNVAIKDSEGHELDVNEDGSINARLPSLNTPVITNLDIITADTEYSHTFPLSTKKFSIRARNKSKLQVSFIVGTSGTNFKTIFPGNSYEETRLDVSTLTVYIRGNKNSEIVEIVSWS